MAKYRVSLDDVKDAGLVKAVVASKLNEFAAATEKPIGEAVAEEEWVQVADVRLPPPEKLRGDVSSHVEEGQLRNEEKWDVATVYGSAHNALTPCLG